MTEQEIYKLWFSNTKDHRYLRPKRWDVLKQVIDDYKVKTVLEFGSGISTILLASLGLNIHSYETDSDYMKFVSSICPKSFNVSFRHWNNNKPTGLNPHYDLSLVDGILPRISQLALSIEHSNLIAVDDYAGRLKNLYSEHLTNLQRIDSAETLMAVFKKDHSNFKQTNGH